MSSSAEEKAALLPHNQALLDLLSNGEAVTYPNSDGVEERNQVSIPSQIQVSLSSYSS